MGMANSKTTWTPHTRHGELDTADRELAFARIKKAAKHYDVEMEEKSWHDLGKRPHTRNRSQD
jgi:hypothetical protein